MRGNDRSTTAVLISLGAAFVLWFALLIAPYTGGGLPEIITNLPAVMNHPFHIVFCSNTLKTALVLLLAYGLGIGIWLSSGYKFRRGEEHGSAQWGSVRQLNRRYSQQPPSANKILTQNFRIGFNGRKHMRNLNTIVVGGSGSGKTRYVVKPNILQSSIDAGASLVILDPKAEAVRSTGAFLEQCGYEVRVLDLIDMAKSHCYNPFVYLENDNDVQRLVTNLFKSTTPVGSQTTDPFWDNSAMMLLSALIYYLHYEAPPEEQNFAMVMDMIRAGTIEDEEDPSPTPLDCLFTELQARSPEHIALKYYRSYHGGAAKTLKSIQITLSSRLEKFNLVSLAQLTMTDELDLSSMGEKRVALFAVIPDNDTSFNFLVSILYTQLFQQLFSCADQKYDGSLPVPVHFLLDEFANVALPTSFDKILSVMRSRNIFVTIILQNMAQLKALFEKEWESIVGNCDTLLYLGGNERSTHEYISKLLGKETINSNTFGKTTGSAGHYSTNTNLGGRELLMEDEVRMLDNRYGILFIRGERPVVDLKYDIMKHPNIRFTEDGGAPAYEHGRSDLSIATLQAIWGQTVADTEFTEINSSNYQLLSDEDFEDNKEEIRRPK